MLSSAGMFLLVCGAFVLFVIGGRGAAGAARPQEKLLWRAVQGLALLMGSIGGFLLLLTVLMVGSGMH